MHNQALRLLPGVKKVNVYSVYAYATTGPSSLKHSIHGAIDVCPPVACANVQCMAPYALSIHLMVLLSTDGSRSTVHWCRAHACAIRGRNSRSARFKLRPSRPAMCRNVCE